MARFVFKRVKKDNSGAFIAAVIYVNFFTSLTLKSTLSDQKKKKKKCHFAFVLLHIRVVHLLATGALICSFLPQRSFYNKMIISNHFRWALSI